MNGLHIEKHVGCLALIVTTFLTLVLVPASAEEAEPAVTAPTVPAEDGLWRRTSWTDNARLVYNKTHDILGDHLHVGIRSMQFEFTDEMSRVGQDEDNYFLGSIDELVDIQDRAWGDITVGLYLNRNFGVEYRHDEVRARTFTAADNNHSDGDLVVEGPIYSAVLRLPLDQVLRATHAAFNWPPYSEGREYDFLSRFVPYVGISRERLAGSFEEATWWAHGYSSPRSWESLGSSPTIIRNNHTRSLEVSDEDVGRYRLHGIAVRVIDNLYFDVSWSSVDIEVTIDFYLDGRYESTGFFPMSYETTTLGVRYFF